MLDIFIGLFLAYTLFSLLASTVFELGASYLNLRGLYLIIGLKKILHHIDGKGGGWSPGDLMRFLTDMTGISRLVTWLNRTVMGKKNYKFQLTKSDLVDEFLEHPRIKQLEASWLPLRTSVSPAWLSAGTFSHVLVEKLREEAQGKSELVKAAIEGIPVKGLKKILLEIWDKVDNKAETVFEGRKVEETVEAFELRLRNKVESKVAGFRDELEIWYNEVMGRVTAWYKGMAQVGLFVLGVFFAWQFNADSVKMYKHLATDKASRDQLVALAQDLAGDSTATVDSLKNKLLAKAGTLKPDSLIAKQNPEIAEAIAKQKALYEQVTLQIDDIKNPLGIGWEDGKQRWLWGSLPGYLLTAFAISLGAQFWFDMLKKALTLRAGKLPASDSKESSK